MVKARNADQLKWREIRISVVSSFLVCISHCWTLIGNVHDFRVWLTPRPATRYQCNAFFPLGHKGSKHRTIVHYLEAAAVWQWILCPLPLQRFLNGAESIHIYVSTGTECSHKYRVREIYGTNVNASAAQSSVWSSYGTHPGMPRSEITAEIPRLVCNSVESNDVWWTRNHSYRKFEYSCLCKRLRSLYRVVFVQSYVQYYPSYVTNQKPYVPLSGGSRQGNMLSTRKRGAVNIYTGEMLLGWSKSY